eukprot:358445-Chlamydomonas_euryale.AAC.9
MPSEGSAALQDGRAAYRATQVAAPPRPAAAEEVASQGGPRFDADVADALDLAFWHCSCRRCARRSFLAALAGAVAQTMGPVLKVSQLLLVPTVKTSANWHTRDCAYQWPAPKSRH